MTRRRLRRRNRNHPYMGEYGTVVVWLCSPTHHTNTHNRVIELPRDGLRNTEMYTTIVKLRSPPREYIGLINKGSDLLWVSCNQCDNCPQSNGLGFKFNFFDKVNSSTAVLIHCSDCQCPFGVQGADFKFNFFDTMSSSTTALIHCSYRICPFEVQGADVRCSPPIKHCRYTYEYQYNSTISGVYVTDKMHFDMILRQPSPSNVNSSSTVFFGCCINLDWGLIETPTAFDGIFGFGPGTLSFVSQLSAREILPSAFSH
ncbi:aspartic proteinase 39-like [Cicer arietinum]|uniref:Aspartic proteinase-like protein 2 n=1 Tax=Cicer arietinum TaxID=3827 RepID=A0A1S2YMV9_CICAR|nr:aspartic proteinase-like protein 2 [Cicer arietinum]